MTFDPTKPVQTRDGRPARIICIDVVGDRPILALIKEADDGAELSKHYYKNGIWSGAGHETADDLVNVTEQNFTADRGPHAGPIPQGWIERYVEAIEAQTAIFPAGSSLRAGGMLRCAHVMDMLNFWRGRDDRQAGDE